MIAIFTLRERQIGMGLAACLALLGLTMAALGGA
jgi:hypothetical protein